MLAADLCRPLGSMEAEHDEQDAHAVDSGKRPQDLAVCDDILHEARTPGDMEADRVHNGLRGWRSEGLPQWLGACRIFTRRAAGGVVLGGGQRIGLLRVQVSEANAGGRTNKRYLEEPRAFEAQAEKGCERLDVVEKDGQRRDPAMEDVRPMEHHPHIQSQQAKEDDSNGREGEQQRRPIVLIARHAHKLGVLCWKHPRLEGCARGGRQAQAGTTALKGGDCVGRGGLIVGQPVVGQVNRPEALQRGGKGATETIAGHVELREARQLGWKGATETIRPEGKLIMKLCELIPESAAELVVARLSWFRFNCTHSDACSCGHSDSQGQEHGDGQQRTLSLRRCAGSAVRFFDRVGRVPERRLR